MERCMAAEGSLERVVLGPSAHLRTSLTTLFLEFICPSSHTLYNGVPLLLCYLLLQILYLLCSRLPQNFVC